MDDEIFNHEDSARHRQVIGYYDPTTKEYKVRVRLGLNEWCLTRFFDSDLDSFKAHFDRTIIDRLGEDSAAKTLIDSLKLDDWQYGRTLPETIEGFELFIRPSRPIEFTNGSFIIINYVDFERARDLTVYYNIYGDEFSAESRTDGHTHVLYDFDAKTLDELEQRLRTELERCLLRLHSG